MIETVSSAEDIKQLFYDIKNNKRPLAYLNLVNRWYIMYNPLRKKYMFEYVCCDEDCSANNLEGYQTIEELLKDNEYVIRQGNNWWVIEEMMGDA